MGVQKEREGLGVRRAAQGTVGQKQDRGVSGNMKGQSKTVTKNMEKWPLDLHRKKPLDSCSGMIGGKERHHKQVSFKVHVGEEKRGEVGGPKRAMEPSLKKGAGGFVSGNFYFGFSFCLFVSHGRK